MIASIITGVVTGPYMWHFVNHTTIFEAYRKMIITGYYGAELAMIYLGLNVIPDYITLFETRLILRVIRCSHASLWLLLMLCDIAFTIATPICALVTIRSLLYTDTAIHGNMLSLWVYNWRFVLAVRIALMVVPPAMLTSILLWLYAGSGFLLKEIGRA